MLRFTLRRVLQAILSLWVVITIVFVLVRMTGSPVAMMLDQQATEEDEARLKAALGLDKPIAVQYITYLGGVLRGDFGDSIRSRGYDSLELVLNRFPATLQLGGSALALSLLLGIPAGVYTAVKRGRFLDGTVRSAAFFAQAVPPFFAGMGLILLFAVYLRLLPAGGKGGAVYLILPAMAIGLHSASGIMRLTRSSMLNVLHADYIRTARAKGLGERAVVWKHAFRNAMTSVLTYTSIIMVSFLTGTVVTEVVFAWPGVGRLILDSIMARDFPVVQTGVTIMAALYITTNLTVDLLYGVLDPRVRFR